MKLRWFFLCFSLSPFAVTAILPAQTISFAKPIRISTGAPSGQWSGVYLTGNFNGDHKTDLVVANTDFYIGEDTTFEFLSGDGTGNFTQGPAIDLSQVNGARFPQDALVADANGDGKDDIVTVIGGSSEQGTNTPGALTVLLSNGNGQFTAGHSYPLDAGIPMGIVGDFNKDGKPDVAVILVPGDIGGTNITNGELVVFLNQGGGSFKSTVYQVPVITDQAIYDTHSPQLLLTNLAAGDFNGDGSLDLAMAYPCTDGHDCIYTFSGDGKGAFGAAQQRYKFDTGIFVSGFSSLKLQTGLLASDITGDNRADLLVSVVPTTQGGNPRIPTLSGKSSGGFQWASAVYLSVLEGISLGFADLNGDGKQDLIYLGLNRGNTLSYGAGIYPGLGNGMFQTPHIPFTVTDTNQNASPNFVAVPLNTGDLPSLIISDGKPSLEVLVNTTKH